jgi:anti-sigma regulatory factor (Ser/Thr protein kinase)
MLILIVLPGFSSMVPVARMAVRNLLPGCPRVDDAELIVSELATTAVRHSTSRGGQFELSLDIYPGRLRIEVRDGGPFGYPPPAPLAAPPFPVPPWTTLYEEDQQRDRAAEVEEYGLGLALINAACDRWGHSRYPDHAVWWAELTWPDPVSTPTQNPTSNA